MNKREYEDWCERTGHITCSDWAYQEIRDDAHFFIINPETDRFSLVRLRIKDCYYQILVRGWEDFNGWAREFHEETGGFYKKIS